MIDICHVESGVKILLTVLLVNCHVVSGKILDFRISRQKVLSNGTNNQEKLNGGLFSKSYVTLSQAVYLQQTFRALGQKVT